jgi:hypothetical protein
VFILSFTVKRLTFFPIGQLQQAGKQIKSKQTYAGFVLISIKTPQNTTVYQVNRWDYNEYIFI